MISRAALIAALVLTECAIAGAGIVSLHGDQAAQLSPSSSDVSVAPGPALLEGGPRRVFAAGMHPALMVDIGNADLNIRTGPASQFDVSVSKSTAYGMFRAKAPITAHIDGETMRLATIEQHGWSMGDDRMVTLVVPPETRVSVENAGDIKASSLRAEALFTSANGSITVEDYNAPALHIASSNGRISLFRIVAARLDVTSSDGRVEGTDLQVRDGRVESSNGRVSLGFSAGADTLVTAEASNGKVRVFGIASNAYAATTHDADDHDESSSRTVRIGAGAGRLDVQSSNGNIDISKS